MNTYTPILRVLIVEDESAARANLKHKLEQCADDLNIVGETDSVTDTIAWLQKHSADIIFMDVELSDGNCFEIFRQINIDAKVVITTAYDQYAIKAFREHCVDYLLKPINDKLLLETIDRLRQSTIQTDYAALLKSLTTNNQPQKYKKRFTVKRIDKVVIIQTKDIAYFMSEDKSTYIYTRDGKQYHYEESLDMLETMLDPRQFFRAARALLININCVLSFQRQSTGRLLLQVEPAYKDPLLVSRLKVSEFIHWVNQ